MSKKLTLSIDDELITFAHIFAKNNKTSISALFERYLTRLKDNSEPEHSTKFSPDLPPQLKALYGILKGVEVPDKKELRRMFHEKSTH
ncbi:hypothetical protein AGMMS50268_19400 [Spirochaetia bacterium]|nr:hypothetical protein AGMMS49546_18850 [Spirochaetia bacterium]GHV91437.1 hypothetical protein AGMMS50268_19400 [Spirochaetia bacterium]